MVAIHRATLSKDPRRGVNLCVIVVIILILSVWINVNHNVDPSSQLTTIDSHKNVREDKTVPTGVHTRSDGCPVASILDLSTDDLHPIAGDRHMVTPPAGGNVSLVCCSTTKGSISLILHHNWAPLGVARFLEMVQSRYYFESQVPLFRCTDACQFGLAGDPSWTKKFNKPLMDDPMWLPPGPKFRENQEGVRRYPRGFLTYAGSGKNSRSNQFVLTLKPNKFMGGGSPWEVPLGELVGQSSFETLSKFYTGYGEKGPSQALLRREGNSDRVRTEWPHLDYITGCNLLESKLLQ